MMGNTLFPADPGIAGRLGMQMSSTLVASIAGTPIAGAILDRYTTIDPVTGVKSSNFTPMILYAGIVMLLGNGLNVIIKGNMAKWTLKGFMKRE